MWVKYGIFRKESLKYPFTYPISIPIVIGIVLLFPSYFIGLELKVVYPDNL